MACKKEHNQSDIKIKDLPIDQGQVGRHKCASCAYEIGFEHGKARDENIKLYDELNSIDESQKISRRHISPHAAYALGYLDGVKKSYE